MEVILYDARRSSPYDSLTDVLTKWLTWNYPCERLGEPSLSMLVKAVDTYDHPLAIKVFQKFSAMAGEPIIEVHVVREVNWWDRLETLSCS